MWTEIQFEDQEETEDGFAEVHLYIRECDHHVLPLETVSIGAWGQIKNDFEVDFPRFTLCINNQPMDSAAACMDALRRRVGENKMRELVGLCTQGALVQAYTALCQLNPPPAHVLSAGGDTARAHRVHIWLDGGDTARVQHARSFVLARIDCHGNVNQDENIDMELQLRPQAESLLVVARRV